MIYTTINMHKVYKRKNGNQLFQEAFSLVELMIVIAILGIIAAIVIPEFQDQSLLAKEAAAKDSLRIFREAIERYAFVNNEIPPGYPGNDPLAPPGNKAITDQLVLGGYLTGWPENPFNNQKTVLLIENNETFPAEATQTDLYGWIYQPASKTIKLNTSGTDSKGLSYFNY